MIQWMSEHPPTGPTRPAVAPAVRLPDEALMPSASGPLRDQLISLVEMIEQRARGVQVSLWLDGTAEARFEVRTAAKKGPRAVLLDGDPGRGRAGCSAR